MGDRTAKARLQEVKMTESKFADDVSIYTSTRVVLEQVSGELVRTAAEWNITVILEKIKLLTLGW